MIVLGAVFRLLLFAVPAGLALYVNSALGWLIAVCTALVIFCLYKVRDELVQSLPAQLEAYFEVRPQYLSWKRGAEEARREAASRERWLDEQWAMLDAKDEAGIVLSEEERLVYEEANRLRDERASELRRGITQRMARLYG